MPANRPSFDNQMATLFQRIGMGLLTGLAIGWVLIRYRRLAENDQAATPATNLDRLEIDITEPKIPVRTKAPELVVSKSQNLVSVVDAEEKLKSASSNSKPASQAEDVAKLENIRGIGPVFAAKLRAAGVHNLTDLAAQSPQFLESVLQARGLKENDYQKWIDEAEVLSS